MTNKHLLELRQQLVSLFEEAVNDNKKSVNEQLLEVNGVMLPGIFAVLVEIALRLPEPKEGE